MPSIPLVSVIIAAWNSEKHLPHCLSALSRQTFRNFEVIVVDNGSTDGSLVLLETNQWDFPMQIKHLSANRGFAAANNIGARLAQGEWLALLNADAYPEPGWLENLVKATWENPHFNFFSSCQLQYHAHHLLDGAGDAYHISGLAWRQYYNLPAESYGLQTEEVFGACAAAAFYRRDDFIYVDGFDETYFSYFEDVDLSFRLRLAGGRCLYVSDAVVHHVGSSSTGKTSDFAYYYVHRNMVLTFFKNMPAILFWCLLPLHLLVNVYLTLSFLIKGKRYVVLKAKLDALRALPSTLGRRRQVQQMRKVSICNLYRAMIKDIFAPRRAARAKHIQNEKDTRSRRHL